MSIETDLFTYLTGLTLANQIGALIGDRLYPEEFPQADSPEDELQSQITYEIIGRNRDRAQDGETGLTNVRFRLDCRAGTYAARQALETALLAAFYQFNKTGTRRMGDSWVQSAEIEEAADDDTPATFSDEQGLFHVLVDLDLWYEEPAPAMV